MAAARLLPPPVTASPPEVAREAEEAHAKRAGLRYVNDATPGIRRTRSGKGWRYTTQDGRPVRDEATLRRIRALVLPPAWTDVWICPREDGHLQATGRDARGRKQYRYHARWREVRDETKYHRLLAFGEALPAMRRRVERDLALPGMPREKVLATVVRLLDRTYIRVGNGEYARQNGSYGLTTLRNHHATVRGATVRFEFKGKSGKKHAIAVTDRRVATVVRRCQDLPGQEIFAYVDDEGRTRDVDSADVNDYLREISGSEFTAKDFRTWAGTVLAAAELAESEPARSETEGRRSVARAIERVAERLGNTAAVCRKCYVHPAVLDSYLQGSFAASMEAQRGARPAPRGLQSEEQAVLRLLRRCSTARTATAPAGSLGAAARRARSKKRSSRTRSRA